MKGHELSQHSGCNVCDACGHPHAPVDMVLFCPACGLQHVDAPEMPRGIPSAGGATLPGWTNPPHRSHLCASCGTIWRPADVATNGVQAIRTKGERDSIVVRAMPEQRSIYVYAPQKPSHGVPGAIDVLTLL